MGSVSQEKLETMLKVYRDKLAKAETPPIDYVGCLRLSAQIGMLEDLWFIARQDAAQHSVQRTADNEHVFPCNDPTCEICDALSHPY